MAPISMGKNQTIIMNDEEVTATTRYDELTKEREERIAATVTNVAALLNRLIWEGKGDYQLTCNDEYQIYITPSGLSYTVDDDDGVVDLHGRP